MNLVKCKFLDSEGNAKGRENIYATNDDLGVGEIVKTQDGKKAAVTETGISEENVSSFANKIKYVSRAESEPEAEGLEQTASIVEPVKVNPDALIVIEQLPVITERLAMLSDIISEDIKNALALECSEANKQEIKKIRARLSKDFAAFEERRKIVKRAVEEPYKRFEEVYRQCVSDKYIDADSDLKEKINAVENEQKQRLRDSVESYFKEYATSKNIDFITFESTGIKVGVSDNPTNLKKQAKAFIDRIAEDLALIETQAHKEEILVEYHKSLNVSQAITSVSARHKAIEEQKARQAELEEKKAAEHKAIERVEESMPAPLAPPDVNPEVASDSIKTLSFKVTAPISRLKELKKFLDDGGYKYE